MITRLLFYIGYYVLNVALIKDPFAFIATLPMAALVSIHLRGAKGAYLSPQEMIAFMMYLFFVIEPLQVIDHGKLGNLSPVSGATYSNGEIGIAMSIATIFYASYLVILNLRPTTRTPCRAFELSGLAVPILLAVAAVSFVAHVAFAGGLSSVLASRYDRLALQVDETSSTAAALSTATTGIMTMCTILISSCLRRSAPLTLLCFAIALGMLVIIANPFNASRFGLLEAYVPMIFILMKGRVKTGVFYVASMTGIVVIFPVLNITTRYGVGGLNGRGAGDLTDAFALRNVDAFDMLTECVSYVQRHGYSYGAKLFADLVVFVPRTWWPGKPLLGGLDVGADVLYYHLFGTANVSQIIAADGYMDFGLPGVILVGTVVGFVVRHLLQTRDFLNGHDLFAYIFISALPILIRGPLAAVVTVFLFQAITLACCRRYFATRIYSGALMVKGLSGDVVTPRPALEAEQLATR